MRITELQYQQRRTGSEVTITFDDASGIALDAELAMRFHLVRGMEVSPETIEQMKHEDELIRAKRKLIPYLSLRKKSTADARLYLKKQRFPIRAVNLAIEYATEMKYLDDVSFAEALARTRMKAGSKGPRAVSNELQAHGIDREEAWKAVKEMAEPENQIETARRIAARKYLTLKDSEDLVKAARKLSQLLGRRGFDPDICDTITREFFGDPTQF